MRTSGSLVSARAFSIAAGLKRPDLNKPKGMCARPIPGQESGEESSHQVLNLAAACADSPLHYDPNGKEESGISIQDRWRGSHVSKARPGILTAAIASKRRASRTSFCHQAAGKGYVAYPLREERIIDIRVTWLLISKGFSRTCSRRKVGDHGCHASRNVGRATA